MDAFLRSAPARHSALSTQVDVRGTTFPPLVVGSRDQLRGLCRMLSFVVRGGEERRVGRLQHRL